MMVVSKNMELQGFNMCVCVCIFWCALRHGIKSASCLLVIQMDIGFAQLLARKKLLDPRQYQRYSGSLEFFGGPSPLLAEDQHEVLLTNHAVLRTFMLRKMEVNAMMLEDKDSFIMRGRWHADERCNVLSCTLHNTWKTMKCAGMFLF